MTFTQIDRTRDCQILTLFKAKRLKRIRKKLKQIKKKNLNIRKLAKRINPRGKLYFKRKVMDSLILMPSKVTMKKKRKRWNSLNNKKSNKFPGSNSFKTLNLSKKKIMMICSKESLSLMTKNLNNNTVKRLQSSQNYQKIRR